MNPSDINQKSKKKKLKSQLFPESSMDVIIIIASMAGLTFNRLQLSDGRTQSKHLNKKSNKQI